MDDRIERLLADHRVNDHGIALVRCIRDGDPARAVDGRAGNVCGRYPSRKMKKTIQYESRTVEFAFVISCETDDAVLEYYDQPCSLSLDYVRASGRRGGVVSHTPDFLVLGIDFAGFVECKPLGKLAELGKKMPGRYVDTGDGSWGCPPGEAAAAAYGLGYRVWTPEGVTGPLVENARFLEDEWGRSGRTFPDADVERVRERVETRQGILLEELVADVGDPAVVHWCIFRRLVHVDLAAAFLSHPDRVRVFTDASAGAAWSAAVASVSDDREGAADILARAVVAEYPPEALTEALERYRVLRRAIEEGLPAHRLTGPKRETRRRWLLAYRKAERESGIGLVGLCPKSHRRGNFKPRFPERTYEVIAEVIADKYENHLNLTKSQVHGLAREACSEKGLPCVSYSRFLDFLSRRDQERSVLRRRGAKAAAAAAPAFGPRDPGVHGQGPMDVVHIDHTLLDVLVWVGPCLPAAAERLWLTVAICAWSRCIVGYDLSFDAPAVAGLFTAVRDLFARQGRMPNRIVVDRGPEFGSTAFEQLCAACGVDHRQRPPGKPKFGAVVERMFGTANTQLIHALSGNTQLLRNPRAMSREVSPVRDAVWRLPDLDAALARFFFDVYPRQPHEGLEGLTPHDRFEQGLAMIGTGRRLRDTSDLRFLLWPPSRRGKAMVNSREGIVVDYIRYWHDDMRSAALHRKKVPVRVDPHDVGHVVAFIDGRWVLCVSESSADLVGRSRREVRLASVEVRRRRSGAAKRRMIRGVHLIRMLSELAETEEGLRQARRDEERREVMSRRELHLVAGSGSSTGEPVRPDAAAWKRVSLDELGPGRRL